MINTLQMSPISSPSFRKPAPQWILVIDEVRAVPSPSSAPDCTPYGCPGLRRWFIVAVLFVLVSAERAAMVRGGVDGHGVGVVSERPLPLTHVSWKRIL
jgi:hypothetical protein